MPKVTDRDVCWSILRLTQQHGYPPSVLELAQDLDIVKSAVQYHLDRLYRQGKVMREPGKPRTLRVVL